MRVGIGQINTWAGGVGENLSTILDRIDEARGLGCSIVSFPEYAIPGAFPLDLVHRPGFVHACDDALEQIRIRTEELTVLVGSIAEDGHNRSRPVLRNCVYVLADGSLLGRIDKTILTDGPAGECDRFEPGPGERTLSVGSSTLAITVGDRLDLESGPIDLLGSLGAEWIHALSATPFVPGGSSRRLEDARAAARTARTGIVFTNGVGGVDGVVLEGGSFVIDPSGRCLFHAPSFVEGLYPVDLEGIEAHRSATPDTLHDLRAAIELGIRDFVTKCGFQRVIVGISGGIDSALVAALAVESLGAETVLGVYLPSVHSSEESARLARDLSRRLGIRLLELGIDDVHRTLRRTLPSEPSGIVDENLQARARAVLWMALANETRALVLSTGNKSEAAVGYSTLYGDTTGALAPIADLYKGDVYRLARTFADRIPQDILSRPPSAELHAGQRDEDDLPPYDVLDGILRERLAHHRSAAELTDLGYDAGVVADVLRRVDRSEFKRHQLPPAVVVSDHPLSDRHIPLTNRFSAAPDVGR